MIDVLVGLPPIWASFLSALALILYELLVEKYYVAYYSALMNVVFGAISLSSVLVPLNLYFFTRLILL